MTMMYTAMKLIHDTYIHDAYTLSSLRHSLSSTKNTAHNNGGGDTVSSHIWASALMTPADHVCKAATQGRRAANLCGVADAGAQTGVRHVCI